MILNYQQIISKQLLLNDDALNYENASYNLTIGKIIDSKGQIVIKYEIPPQGMVMVVSKETFNLTDTVIGYTTVKNKLSISGILAINIGIVDSGYKGPISSVLINFGKDGFEINQNDPFMRMTFHEFSPPSPSKGLSARNYYNDESHYLAERKKDAKILGDKFLYLDNEIKKYKDDTITGIKEYFSKLGQNISILCGALALFFAAGTYAFSTFNGENDLKDYKSVLIINNKLSQQDSIINAQKLKISKQDSIIKQINLALKPKAVVKRAKPRRKSNNPLVDARTYNF